MTDQALDIFKLAFLGLLYLFFGRVLWAVWSEVRAPANAKPVGEYVPPTPAAAAAVPSVGADAADTGETKPAKGKRGVPARVVVLEPQEHKGVAFPIGETLPIGRDVETGVRINDDAFVSGLHAKLLHRDGAVFVDDLGSRNGTYLNGARLADQRRVSIGDRIQIGYTVLEAQ